MVYDGRLYVYTGHDEDTLVNGFFTMNDWRVYSSTDMVNWTDHGSPLSYKNFSWSSGDAWAGQVIYRNGKFYYYVSTNLNGGKVLGVAVSDSPTGPFKDPLGKPLLASDCGTIDPTVFIDDDGQAYLYWGNPNLCYVKLKADMISYQGSVVHVPMTTASFGVQGLKPRCATKAAWTSQPSAVATT
jgi:beta-xylosidase